MDVVVFGVAAVLFLLGGALAIQGFFGKEPVSRLDLNPYTRRFEGKINDPPQPDRHRVRLMLIGFALMVLGVVFLAVMS